MRNRWKCRACVREEARQAAKAKKVSDRQTDERPKKAQSE